ncbi:unnamed protein product [Staurois parvus]|uniref:Uncharacterized protein n=1 Tax=Staurois parvus TaxID=386267 RepID=A0ABN9C3U7_9NEOB|nr:unnamed protein product [Staurois parvus]
MGDIERQLRWTLICGTDRWHFWGHTDHQGTLISALMITREERNADNRHFHVYM